MKKKILSLLAIVCIALVGKSQDLDNFTTTLSIGDYLSIASKKVYTATDASMNKPIIDFVLLSAKADGKQKLEWYNMNGKDGNIPKEIMGTATLINTISFDKEQFDKCKTNKDLKRMTGHITNSSLSHFASISDDTKKGIDYHCFIIQLQNGKRGLMWLDINDKNSFDVAVKMQVE